MPDSPYTVEILDNGLVVLVEQMPDVRSTAAGFLVCTGARDDTAPLAGVSHFLEHMMFKGTARRSWRDITIDFDRLGSTYNAYTSQERTVYYGWVRDEDIETQLELLADMMRPTLPDEEFQTERKVVLEEIAMSADHLEHVMFDFLQEKVFAGHPLAWPVLGYERTVKAMTRDQMADYLARRYTPGNMMLIVAGRVEPDRILDAARRVCGHWQPSSDGAQPRSPTDGPSLSPDKRGGRTRASTLERRTGDRTPPTLRTGVDALAIDRFAQQVVALTFPACSACDPRSETAEAAATILGGENSRFFWNIVQRGLAPRAGVYHLDYSDCGAMLLFGSCNPENAEALLEAMRTEADRICEKGVEPHEVARVRNMRRTVLALESEAPYRRLSQLMDDMEYRGAPRTVEQMLADVEAVSVDSIRAYFEAFPINTGGHLTSVGPRHWPETS